MANFISGIISITLGVIMVANVFMVVVHTTNTTTWSGSEVAMWSILGLAGVIGMVYGTFAVFGLA